MVASLAAGVWGAQAWLRQRPSVTFWYVLRLSQGFVIAQVVLGVLLAISGRAAADELHYVYGLLPLVVSLITESMRAGGAHRELRDVDLDSLTEADQEQIALRIVRFETGIMALGALIIFGLALRAGMTSGHLF